MRKALRRFLLKSTERVAAVAVVFPVEYLSIIQILI